MGGKVVLTHVHQVLHVHHDASGKVTRQSLQGLVVLGGIARQAHGQVQLIELRISDLLRVRGCALSASILHSSGGSSPGSAAQEVQPGMVG